MRFCYQVMVSDAYITPYIPYSDLCVEQLQFGHQSIQDQLSSFKFHVTLMKSGDNRWCRSNFLVQTGLKVMLFTSCALYSYQKRQAVVWTCQCSVRSCYAHTGHTAAPGESLLHVRMALLFPALPKEKVLPRAVFRHNPSQGPLWALSGQGFAIVHWHGEGLSLIPHSDPEEVLKVWLNTVSAQ